MLKHIFQWKRLEVLLSNFQVVSLPLEFLTCRRTVLLPSISPFPSMPDILISESGVLKLICRPRLDKTKGIDGTVSHYNPYTDSNL